MLRNMRRNYNKAIIAFFAGALISAPVHSADRAIKCGLSFGYDQLLTAQTAARPSLRFFYDSPSGYFRIHYETDGNDAVLNSGVDNFGAHGVPGPDGVPDHINSVAEIFDSVRAVILGDTAAGGLGYQVPPPDTIFDFVADTNGLYDIYMSNLRGNFFGITFSETQVPDYFIAGNPFSSFTSYILIDNDYVEPSYSGVNDYLARPLDAVRVTAAHQYIHAVHFGIDAFEFEGSSPNFRFYWYEISAIAMEELLYDEINDYYAYLYNLFNTTPFRQPFRSLQTYRFAGFDSDFSNAMGVFGIYLNDKFGPDLTMNIWRGCGRQGPDFLHAIDSALISHTSGEYNLNKAYQEFGVWMLFTGSRAKFAPDGMRFDEAEFYPEIPSDVQTHAEYPVFVNNLQQEPEPESNSNSYIFLNELDRVVGDCFRTMVSAGEAVRSGITPGLTLIGIPANSSVETQVLFSEYTDTIFDTTVVVEPDMADAIIEQIIAEHPCHGTVSVDTLAPPGFGASLTLRVVISGDIPSINLPNPTSYQQAIFIVTLTSTDWTLYEGDSGPATYPFGYAILAESDVQTDADQIEDQIVLPDEYSLEQNYPNPFNGSAIIRYSLPKRTGVALDIYNVIGQHVRTLVNGAQSSGSHQVAWNARDEAGRNVASGLYFYRLRAGETVLSRSMLYIK